MAASIGLQLEAVWLQMLPLFRASTSPELIKATQAQLHEYSIQARF